MSPPRSPSPAFPDKALAFVWHYLLRRRLAYGGIFALVVAAALCAVAIQYGVRLMVDAMAGGEAAGGVGVGEAFGIFVGLVGAECVLWRLAG